MKRSATFSLISLLFSVFGLLAFSPLFAQCPLPETMELVREDFEGEALDEWIASATDGGNWQVDAGNIGFYENPGENRWMYVNDEAADQIGRAELYSPVYTFNEPQQYLELTLDLNFQEYYGQGRAGLEILSNGDWINLFEFREDIIAHLVIDISPYANQEVQLRFYYDDEGAWGWGFGFDNLTLQGTGPTCGNGVCDLGEKPENCPGDCPFSEGPAPQWIPLGQDLDGNSVAYQSFQGGTQCDDCSEKVNLGFEFDFFGDTYEEIYINSNGNLSLEAPLVSFTPEAFCLAGPRLIAPFFADADLSRGGEIWYYVDPHHHYLIVSWLELGYFGCEAPCELSNTFQVILTDGSLRVVNGQILPFETNAIFTYGDMQWTAGNSSGGTDGLGGIPATVGINQGNGNDCMDYGQFDRPGFEYYGNRQKDGCESNSISHLDYRTIHFCGSIGSVASYSDSLMVVGELVDHGIWLQWETDKMDSTEFFMIQRKLSAEKDDFEALDLVYPEAGQYHFEYLDTEPLPQSNIYRIVRVKIDGVYSSSREVELEIPPTEPASGPANLYSLRVGPNPFHDQLTIHFELQEAGLVLYSMTDLSGRVVLQGTTEGQFGVNQLPLQVPELPNAIYVLSVQQGEEKKYVNLVRH